MVSKSRRHNTLHWNCFYSAGRTICLPAVRYMLEQDQCTAMESLFEAGATIVWLGFIVGVLFFGWAGRLLGARINLRSA